MENILLISFSFSPGQYFFLSILPYKFFITCIILKMGRNWKSPLRCFTFSLGEERIHVYFYLRARDSNSISIFKACSNMRLGCREFHVWVYKKNCCMVGVLYLQLPKKSYQHLTLHKCTVLQKGDKSSFSRMIFWLQFHLE